MDICRQWFIYGKINQPAPAGYDENDLNQPMYDPTGKHGAEVLGGINNGYSKKQLEDFWKSIEGFADYLFNKSHSACYSYITILTAYLKKYYPEQFMAALLSMEDNDEKRANYISATEAMGIQVTVPDINLSGKNFTPYKGRVLFGLNSIKGIGEEKVEKIVAQQPYESLFDLTDKIPKAVLNKTVIKAFAKCGALDRFSNNRYALLNEAYDLRKDKDERYDITRYDEQAQIEFERDTLGAPVSIKPYWDRIKENSKVKESFELVQLEERADKNGRLMGFLKLYKEGSEIKGLVFSSSYAKLLSVFNRVVDKEDMLLEVDGKKDDRGTLIVNSAKAVKREQEEIEERFEMIM